LVGLLALSAFFSGSETAFFSLRPSMLGRLAGEGTPGRRVQELLRQPYSLLSAILIGNLFVNTIASVVATALCVAWLGREGIAVAVPALTVALLLFGEITPKLLALRYRRRQALLAVRPLAVWLRLMRPLLRLVSGFTERLVQLVPLEASGSRPLNGEELATACDLAVEEGALSETRGRLLARLLQLQQLEVRQIMTPRPDVVTLDRDWRRQRILAVAGASGFNRFPVVEGERMQPLGFVHLKDLLGHGEARRPLQEVALRPIAFVPESKNVAELLSLMQSGSGHLAAVVDEHGDTTGIVTLADCLQALLGPVGDVRQPPDHSAVQIDERNWVLGGRLDLREVAEACGIELPPSREYVTLGGFLMARLGRVLAPRDIWQERSARFVVLETEGHKIVSVHVEILPQPEEVEA
jgi:putative hemolysin